MKESGHGKEAQRERRKVDGHAIVAHVPLVATRVARVGQVPAGAPARLVVGNHRGRWHLRDAVNVHGHVFRVGEHVPIPAPVGVVEGHDDHGRVREEAEEVGPPASAGSQR